MERGSMIRYYQVSITVHNPEMLVLHEHSWKVEALSPENAIRDGLNLWGVEYHGHMELQHGYSLTAKATRTVNYTEPNLPPAKTMAEVEVMMP